MKVTVTIEIEYEDSAQVARQAIAEFLRRSFGKTLEPLAQYPNAKIMSFTPMVRVEE